MITNGPTLQRPATQNYVEGPQDDAPFGTQSRQDLGTHIIRYAALSDGWEAILDHDDEAGNDNGSSQAGITSDEIPKSPHQFRMDLHIIKKPKANTISAKQIHEASFDRPTARKRERRLRKSQN
ncbi:hypothetical protein BG015_011687 [Linnemannia schmuckeri]|uniref:Uncharacterized protein n=1 Tax=Linnemannia schmuckeri TaxID=64567 RepID=A0A9P5V7P7_9FUNG|nr:hypothetical protein BG015_011687 [Linnemannia schmuckeri]